jgi:two-component system, chemotaxis family, response regulator Rcp1
MTLEILLVEDDVSQVYLVTKALQRWLSPYNLHTVFTAEEALDFINRRDGYSNAPTPHITLLDLNLPKEPGFTVLKAIKDNPDFRNIAVIVMSSSLADSDIKKAVELHTNAYIRKPSEWAHIETLFAALESFWRLDVRFAMPEPPKAA